MDDIEQILIKYLQKRIEKNNFSRTQNFEAAAYCRESEKELESNFFYLVRDNDEEYTEFEYNEYGIVSFRELLTKYLKDNYNINNIHNYEVDLLIIIFKKIDRDKKLNELGI